MRTRFICNSEIEKINFRLKQTGFDDIMKRNDK